MELIEGELIEFKRVVNDSLVKTVIAFANTSGGIVYVGIEDDGRIAGVADVDAEMPKLASMLRSKVRPDVLMMTSCTVEQMEGKNIIVVSVDRGTKRPYYLAHKGMRPEGVYVRSGAASVPPSDTAILQMIKDTEGDFFETQRSHNQELTFEYSEEKFAPKNLSFDIGAKRTLGLMNQDGLWTNLALLLSDQCPSTVKAASFDDDDRNIFLEREEYSGSLLKQLDDAYSFLSRHNKYKTSFAGLERFDYRDYPEVALREALVNAVVHREYALSGPTLVSVMPTKVEIASLGGLPLGIEPSDLKAHISMPRNKLLANVFFRLEIIEAYGTGIRRMRTSYQESGLTVEYSITPNTFTVVLPNRNKTTVKQSAGKEAPTPTEQQILDLLLGGEKTRLEIQNEIEESQSATIRILGKMAENGLITKIGQGKRTLYRIP